MPISLLHRKSDYSRQQISKAMFTLYILDSSLVARRYLLIHCPRKVWERAGERTRSQRVSLGDVTAHGKVQELPS